MVIIKNIMKVNNKALIINIKQYVINALIISGLLMWLKILWDALEIVFDGGIQESISDTVIASILILIIWNKIRKWFFINKSEDDK